MKDDFGTKHPGDAILNIQKLMTSSERVSRLFIDMVKDELERLVIREINAVQALLLFRIGDGEFTAGELKTRGYYTGTNVSYNLKQLVDKGYLDHWRCEIDRRTVRVRLTEKGRDIRKVVQALLECRASALYEKAGIQPKDIALLLETLQRIEYVINSGIRYLR